MSSAYFEHDFDPDFDDDTPPASPYKHKRPLRTRWTPLYRQYLRWRGFVVFLVIVFGLTYLLRSRRKPIFTPKHSPTLRYKNIDWRLYAYSQYATDSNYLCNSLMIFDQLDRLGSKAERILLYPETLDLEVADSQDRDSQLLIKARDEYGVKLIPVPIEGMRSDEHGGPDVPVVEQESYKATWDMSITKFVTFNQTQYLRILHIDSDSTVLKNMDDLFLSPPARVAMPRAYWKLPKERSLSTSFILLQPSEQEAARLSAAAEAETRSAAELKGKTYDAEILNSLYRDSAMVLPHRAYALTTSEFRRRRERAGAHDAYHGNAWEEWHADRALAEASVVHFDDWPLPKPWVMWPQELLPKMLPQCDYMPGTKQESGCRNRDIWLDLYQDFRRRRKLVCKLLSVPSPDWWPEPKLEDLE